MKLFDYKFLILLALTLVVYFIFREVLDLRKKVGNLKDKVELLENKTPKQISNNGNNIKNNFIDDKKPVFQIPLPKNTNKIDIIETNQNLNNQECTPPNLVHNKLSTIEENQKNSETEEEEESVTGERLAIYSNDNHEDDDSYSLEESSELNTQEVLNNLSDTPSEINDEKKKNLLVETEGNAVNNFEKESNEDEKNSTSEELDDILDLKIENNVILTSEAKSDENKVTATNLPSLMKLKLSQLQCLAEEKNIEITTTNGKKKTKSELANEISENSQNKLLN
tara:strand:- start:830 stop:1675 length:846 start_codon:yes stop_codon:yes gene_type:complete